MSEIKQWLADLALLPEIDIGRWQAFRHQGECRELDAAALPAALRELGAVSGWLCETGRVLALREEIPALQGMALGGEFYRDDSCWQLRQLPRGRWQLQRHQLSPCAADQATHLGERVSQRTVAGGRAHYWRLWAADADRLPQCTLAVLTRIEEEHA